MKSIEVNFDKFEMTISISKCISFGDYKYYIMKKLHICKIIWKVDFGFQIPTFNRSIIKKNKLYTKNKNEFQIIENDLF